MTRRWWKASLWSFLSEACNHKKKRILSASVGVYRRFYRHTFHVHLYFRSATMTSADPWSGYLFCESLLTRPWVFVCVVDWHVHPLTLTWPRCLGLGMVEEGNINPKASPEESCPSFIFALTYASLFRTFLFLHLLYDHCLLLTALTHSSVCVRSFFHWVFFLPHFLCLPPPAPPCVTQGQSWHCKVYNPTTVASPNNPAATSCWGNTQPESLKWFV